MKFLTWVFVLFLVSQTNSFAVKIIGKYNDNIPSTKSVRLYTYDRVQNVEKIINSAQLDAFNNFEFNFNLEKSGVYFLNQTIVYISNSDSVSIILSNDKVIESHGRNSDNYLYYSNIKPYYSGIEKRHFEAIKFDINKVKEEYKIACNIIEEESRTLNLSDEFRKYIYSDIWFKILNSHFKIFNLNRIKIDFNKIELFDNNNNNSYFQMHLIDSIFEALIISSDSIKNDTFWIDFKGKTNIPSFYKEVIVQKRFQMLIQEDPYGIETKKFGMLWNDFFINKTVHEQFLRNHKLLEKIIDPIPENVKNIKFKNYLGIEITFEKLLEKYSGKIIYFDFWAKWCGACIYEFPMIKELKTRFSSTDLETVGLSIDDNFIDFQKAVEKYELDFDNQYYLMDKNNLEFKKYFGLEELPRYHIFNKEGRPLRFESLRPNNKNLDKLLAKYMKLN